MSSWLPQTKRAKSAMEKLGFDWPSDFTVRTPYDHERGGYGRTVVKPEWGKDQEFANKAQEIADAGFEVNILTRSDSDEVLLVAITKAYSDCHKGVFVA